MVMLQDFSQTRTGESVIRDFITKDFGHFVLASDDRILINVVRRCLVSELGLPANSITIVTSEDQILKTVKEMCVRKKQVLLFIQTLFGYDRIDDLIRQVVYRFANCKAVILTTEAEIHHLTLLRDQGIADNWITKPVVINQLVQKISSIIKPHGQVDKLLKAAQEYLDQGAFRNVLAICRKLYEANPESAVAYMLMGDAYRGLDQLEEMVKAYEHASYLDPLFLDPLKRLVAYFQEKNDKDKVLHYLEKLDTLSPLNTERKIEIAKAHLELGHGEEAHEYFDAVMKLTNKRVLDDISKAALQIGAIYAGNNDPQAETYYRKAIDVMGKHLDKSNLHLFNNLGIYLRKMGKWQEAIVEYQRALAIDPASEVISYNLALAYDDAEDTMSAYRYMQQALKLNSALYKQDYVAAYNIGKVFAKAKDKEAAVKVLEYALKLNPDYEAAKALLGSLRPDEAKT